MQKEIHYIEDFLQRSEHDILKFASSFDNAFEICPASFPSVFIPQKNTNVIKPLIVAHADCVHQDNSDVGFIFKDNVFWSKSRHRGVSKAGVPYVSGDCLGADDRAGCAMAFLLREELDIPVLITSQEECGCLSSVAAMANEHIAKFINSHPFVIQLDRSGYNDLVFYNVSTSEFEKYCLASMPGFQKAIGTYTDICVLCEKICGVNISVGYKNEHTPNEILNFRWWMNTYTKLKKWLTNDKHPTFFRS